MIEKDFIITDSGEKKEAVCPVIISASRSTDIPAFYAPWFFNRLEKGYCVWYNPFNRQPSYVSFKKCKAVVFWTKNPKPVIPYLQELDKRGIHYYFQVTLNDYVSEGFEPHVPPVEDRIETFKTLSEMIGKERVIWRFDPLIVTPRLTPRDLLKKIWHIGNRLKGYTDKLVFSFADVAAYRKVQNNMINETGMFTRENVCSAELTEAQRKEIVEGLVKIRDAWEEKGWKISLATCAENIDLMKYGIEKNRCIDGMLLERLFPEDKELIYYLHTGKLPDTQPTLFSSGFSIPKEYKDLKDKGQRSACGCIISKDIGMYNTCNHLCVYCYANVSRETVKKNIQKHNTTGECIISL